MSEKRTGKKSSVKAAPAAPSIAKSGPMDVSLLEQLVKLMADNGLSTVELTDGDKRITLKRGVETVAVPHAPAPAYSYPPPTPASPSPAPAPSSAAPRPAADDESNLTPIKSPMIGTFYAAPAKGSKPFVAIGSAVDEDTEVCLIEAMKNFNPLTAGCHGVIAKILVQDSQPVEYGQVLFLVKPA